MTRRNRRRMSAAGLVLMSIIAGCIGIAIGTAMVVGIVQLYASS